MHACMHVSLSAGAGAGFTLNVPLPLHTGHVGVLRAFDHLVLPAARRFKPDLILVGLGSWGVAGMTLCRHLSTPMT
jgi:acetoin utilization deacetylase AcuC-like enzyme